MADLVVDYALLEQVENTLNSLKREFDGINAVAGSVSDWGSGEIANAMNDFANNWSTHRDQLVQSMEAMSKNARETRTNTQQWDAKNQQQLTKK